MNRQAHVIILSGGGGQRLWPMSNPHTPKPFLKFPKNKSLLWQAFERAKAVVPSKNIWVVTHRSWIKRTAQTLKTLSRKQILGEPQAKNTAPAITWAVREIEKKNGSCEVLVLPADHYIPDLKSFKDHALQALSVAKHKQLVTFGMQIREPKTDYGYIEVEKTTSVEPSKKVKRFVEKPNLNQARAYMDQGNFFWNSGMFAWNTSVFLEQMKSCAPDVLKIFEKHKAISAVYKEVPNVSIDYALMEKSKTVSVLPSTFQWSDLGNWDSVYKSLTTVENKNVHPGRSKVVDGKGNLILSKQKFVLFGVDDLVVVESQGQVLVTKRDKASELKRLLAALEA